MEWGGNSSFTAWNMQDGLVFSPPETPPPMMLVMRRFYEEMEDKKNIKFWLGRLYFNIFFLTIAS